MRNGRILVAVAAVAVMALAALSSPAQAASGTWIGTASGTWSTAGNWAGGTIADGATFTGDLSTVDLTADVTVTIDGGVASRTLGILTIGDANGTNSYTIAGSGGGTLTLDNLGSNSQFNQIATSAGDTLDGTLGILVGSHLDINNASANALTVNGTIAASYGGAKVVKNVSTGAGTVTLGGVISNGPGHIFVTQSSTNSVMALTGTNTYVGFTEITSGVLRASDGVGLSANSWLRFNTSSTGNQGVLEASGTIAREIGKEKGNVYWNNHGGFAAFGGDLTVTLEGGRTLNWGNDSTGFRGKVLMLNSKTATNKVTVTNDMDMAGSRTVYVHDNVNSSADIAEISGDIANGDTSNRNFTKQGAGTLILSGTNTYTGYTDIQQNGTIRAIDGVGLPTTSALRLNQGVFESSGTFTRNIGTGAGAIYWQNNGGLAAAGGALDVKLSGGATIAWNAGTASGLNKKILYLGSVTADNVVTWTNDTELRGNRTIQVNDNPSTTADYAVVSGVLSNGDTSNRQLTKTGDGMLVLAAVNTYTNNTNVNAGTLKVTGSIDASTAIVKTGTILTGGGSVKAITAQAGSTVAPGNSVGTLAAVAGNVSFAAGTIYEWELGAADANDLIDVTGNVTLTNGWELKLEDAGGTPDAGKEYDLFTYSGTATLGTNTIDDSGVGWDTTGASIVDDLAGRIYITGIGPAPGSPAIPEPASAVLLICGAAGLLLRRRRNTA